MVVAQGVKGSQLEFVQLDEPQDLTHFPVVVAGQVTSKDFKELSWVRHRESKGYVLKFNLHAPLSSSEGGGGEVWPMKKRKKKNNPLH